MRKISRIKSNFSRMNRRVFLSDIFGRKKLGVDFIQFDDWLKGMKKNNKSVIKRLKTLGYLYTNLYKKLISAIYFSKNDIFDLK
jgi:hypothetical protein